MPRGRPVDPATRVRVRELHSAGRSRNEIARELGISPSTVSKIAEQAGLSFDRTSTSAATQARQIDHQARRQGIVGRLYARSEAVLKRLEADTYPYVIAVPGQRPEHIEDSAPPAQDERALSNAIASYLTSAAKLEQIDGAPGIAKTASIITRVAEAFGISDA